MASKSQVERKAKTVGATVEIDHYSATVIFPKGKQSSGMHYSAFDFGSCEYKSDVWEMLLDELRMLKDCDCGCAN